MKKYAVVFLSVFLLAGCTAQQQEESRDQNSGTAAASEDSLGVPNPLEGLSFNRSSSSNGQLIYVPVYSHIYQHNQQKTFNLTATLSFRNTDVERELTLTKVLYYDSKGNVVKNYLEQSQKIGPLASTSFVIEEDDLRGGVGANFIVEWRSNQPVSQPIAEAVMISTSQQQGISFLSVGRVLEEYAGSENEIEPEE